MYVCMCVGVTCKQINKALQDGSKDANDLLMNTGAGGCCGSCVPMINEMVDDFHKTNALSPVNVENIALAHTPLMLVGVTTSVDLVYTMETCHDAAQDTRDISLNILDVAVLDTKSVQSKIQASRSQPSQDPKSFSSRFAS